MHQRSHHHDYHGRGIYLITLCTEGRRPLLGRLVGGGPNEAAIIPTPLGEEVLRCWYQIPEIQRQLAAKKTAQTGQPCQRDIRLIECQLMPDHFHGIIFVRQEMDIALGDVIRGFMIGGTKAFHRLYSPQICGAPDQSNALSSPASPSALSLPASSAPSSLASSSLSLPASPSALSLPGSSSPSSPASPSALSLPASSPSGGAFSSTSSFSSMQAGDSSVRCRAYSRDPSSPPAPLWEKGYHDRLLTHEGQLQNMLDYVRDNPRRLLLRRQHPTLFAVQRGVRYAHWTFSSIGQLRLLDAPLTAVHVRRYFTPEQRRAYMNECILAARSGHVLISPFISEFEKRVRDEALLENLFCIQLCNEPFSDYHKPQGGLIDHCSEGHLLLLTLASGTTPERPITRDECTSLNAVAESMARLSLQDIV